MNPLKLAIIILLSTFVLVAWYINANFHLQQNNSENLSALENFHRQLTDPVTQLSSTEKDEILVDKNKRNERMQVEKEFFAAKLPTAIAPIFGELFLSIYRDSPIGCGTVKFDNNRQDWSRFIASHRANVALIESDIQLSDREFTQLFSLVCKQ